MNRTPDFCVALGPLLRDPETGLEFLELRLELRQLTSGLLGLVFFTSLGNFLVEKNNLLLSGLFVLHCFRLRVFYIGGCSKVHFEVIQTRLQQI